MKAGKDKKFGLELLGAVFSAILTSSLFLALTCCAGPIVFLGLGLGFASITTLEALAPYKWVSFLFTIVLLSMAFWQVYKQKEAPNCRAACSNPVSHRKVVLLIIATFVVLSFLVFPFLFEKYLMQPQIKVSP